jgi:ribA/ribD-fused uncharacterized protein
MIKDFDKNGPNFFLSNFYPAPVCIGRRLYPTTEHYYQAMKTLDEGLRQHIAELPTPNDAKTAGRNLMIRDDWEGIKLDVMRLALSVKFAYGSELAVKLLATGDQELIEGNWWGDTFWGICRGVGENWLGKLLMERRQVLISLETSFSSDANQTS